MKLSDLFLLLISEDRITLFVRGKRILHDVNVSGALYSDPYLKYKDEPVSFIFGSDVGRISISIAPEEVTQ